MTDTTTIDVPVVLTPAEKPYDGPVQIVLRIAKRGPGKFIAAVTSPAEADLVKVEMAKDPEYANTTIVTSPFTPEPVLSAADWVAKRNHQKRIEALRAELKAAQGK